MLATDGAYLILKLAEEIAELTISVVCIYLILRTYIHYSQPEYFAPMQKRRLGILFLLILAASIIKVSEDVIGGESGLIDISILLFLHSIVPEKSINFFEIVTLTGSLKVLFLLTTVVTIALLYARRRAEALLVSASAISGAVVIYTVKLITSRTRPELWDTELYWGSSFPSGHTVAVAAFATAIVLCVGKIRPKYRNFAMVIAVLWITFVAFSRLALGVHWPTDVLAATCIGTFIPLAIHFTIESYGR
jgi:undecaprenyl-diphosphatase